MFEQTNQTASAAAESTAFPGEAFESGAGATVVNEESSSAAPQRTEESYAVKYNGKEVLLSLDELKTRAQMGMNYEHVKSENDRIKNSQSYRLLKERAEREGVDMDTLAARLVGKENPQPQTEGDAPYLAFVRRFPQVKAEEIPAQVWERFHQTGDLIGAYTEAENERLRAQISAMEQNKQNARVHIGSLKNDRATAHTDAFLEGLLGG